VLCRTAATGKALEVILEKLTDLPVLLRINSDSIAGHVV